MQTFFFVNNAPPVSPVKAVAAVVGAAGGLELGVVGGGLMAVLAHLGIKKADVIKYEESLHAGNFLVVVQGDEKEVNEAEHILHTEGTHLHLNK